MDKTEISSRLQTALVEFDYIDFAVLFGSVSKGSETTLSDVDIGVHASRELPLLETGYLISVIQKNLNQKADVVILNDLYKKNAVFANEIVKSSSIVLLNDDSKWIEFKAQTYLHYLDIKYMNDLMNEAFLKRAAEGNFGKSKHA
jgi:predicted nucleotidyltransferase